jgi:hypothetical protein
MKCPKCGFHQDAGTECPRCGIIFARYHSEAVSPPREANLDPNPAQPAAGTFRRIYRIFRWVCPAGAILVLFLILRPSSPPRIEASPAAAESAESKIEQFQTSIGPGTEQRLEMDESELNGWLGKNLSLKKQAGSEPAIRQKAEPLIEIAKTATGGQTISNEALEQAQTSVRDVKIELLENSLRVYALFDLHGMDLSLELEGQPVVRNGYIKLEPSSGKLGSLPLMAGTLQKATSRIFDSPENKEKFKLPPNIRDIRIEQGRLIVLSR